MAHDLPQHLARDPGDDGVALGLSWRQKRTAGTPPAHGATLRTAGLGLAALALLVGPAAPALADPAPSAPPMAAPDQESEGVADADGPDTEPDSVTLDPDGSDAEEVDSNEAPLSEDGLDSGRVEAPAPPETVDPAEVQADSPESPPTPSSGQGPGPAPPPRAPDRPPSAQVPISGSEWTSARPPSVASPLLLAPVSYPQRRPARRHSMSSRSTTYSAPHAAGPAPVVTPATRHEPTGRDHAAPVSQPTSLATHTIAPGETLWSIARARLGAEASAASIASEVQRIWRLNARRIGTGSPDLVRPGERLLL